MSTDNSNNHDEWIVVGARKKTKPKPKSTPSNQSPHSNTRRNPGRLNGPVSASFDQGSHFPAFNPGDTRENQQDWTDVTFNSSAQKNKRNKGPTRSERRHEGLSINESRHLSKIEGETESFHHKKVSRDLSQKIINFRASHHLTQKQLAAKMNLPLSVVQSYERGSAVPVGRITNQFHKILNTGI